MNPVYLQVMQNVLTIVSSQNLTDAVESNLLLLFVFLGAACSFVGATGEHPVLDAQVGIANTLEDTTELERPGDRIRAHKEVAHLAAVTNDPSSQDGDTESFARTRSVVGQNLRDGESGLDGETDAAQQADIGTEVGDRSKVNDEKSGDEVTEENPIAAELNGQHKLILGR